MLIASTTHVDRPAHGANIIRKAERRACRDPHDRAPAGARRSRGQAVRADLRYGAADPRDVDPSAARRARGRACATYDAAAALPNEIGTRLAQRLDYMKIDPAAILDVGCATGAAAGELAARYPRARLVALDPAPAMARACAVRLRRGDSLLWRLLAPLRGAAHAPPALCVCADACALPLPGVAFDLLFSNLALPWLNDPPRAFAEFRRTLRVGGLLAFATLGPDTLKELAVAFARADGYTHVNRFPDMHDLGDMLVAAGFADPVMEMETLTVTYAEPRALFAELKALGATNATRGRPRGLSGRGRWERVLAELERRRRDGRLAVSFEVVYGHAWKGEPRRAADGSAIVRFAARPGRGA
jgi:malonyl-CoA O-methyltransferase